LTQAVNLSISKGRETTEAQLAENEKVKIWIGLELNGPIEGNLKIFAEDMVLFLHHIKVSLRMALFNCHRSHKLACRHYWGKLWQC